MNFITSSSLGTALARNEIMDQNNVSDMSTWPSLKLVNNCQGFFCFVNLMIYSQIPYNYISVQLPEEGISGQAEL